MVHALFEKRYDEMVWTNYALEENNKGLFPYSEEFIISLIMCYSCVSPENTNTRVVLKQPESLVKPLY
jgi:hypothetical protein